ncbi:porphyromonas-type peptidyl-arginine deiminase [Longispora fulva]|uniref:Agmatine deiminase n=1 Tax=Longispora fulva TaxID=619741 RepID=A0A8J7GFV5_9ACTN|nr:agmatine deiminase family protein [Longispora fulva]MBG6137051.1 agmatine deiminase [Longispora fulva]GIG61595.1 porphyromonas-type peptidyl-arginine deiminase [Longispora fulva]
MSGFLLSRRTVLRSLAGVGAVALGATACSAPDDSPDTGTAQPPAGRRFGAEWEPHARTFMAWPASDGIWGRQLADVRQDIAGIARAVAGFEPVVLLARPGQEDEAQRACGSDVEVVALPVDDLWTRDTVSVFVEDAGKVMGVDFNFSGWGGKQQHANDAQVAGKVLAKYGIGRIETPVVAEGGSFETDGQGTLLVTESSVVNDNRNRGRTRQQIEADLIAALGVRKVIWFAGVRGKDITDAHVDTLVRFVAPGVVLLDKPADGTPPDVWTRAIDQARGVLKDATDARGKAIEVIDLPQPDPDRITGRGAEFVSSYVNFYVANKSVILPKFGDAAADDRAKQILRDHFPDRDVVQLKIDTIASGGGGIHCSTHDQPGG